MLTSSLLSFEEQTRSRIAAGDLDGALRDISRLVDDVISDQRSIGMVFSSPVLDQLCLEIGQMARRNVPSPVKGHPARTNSTEPVRVYIATELAATGGHSRLLWDLIQADKSVRHIVLVTDLGNTLDVSPIEEFLARAGGTLIVAPKGSYLEKLSWLQSNIRAIEPERIFLLLHHFDSVSVAAIQAEFSDRAVFIHNADHSLCLGVHINCAHVDYHAKGYYNCRDVLGVMDNRFWPLVSEDLGEKAERVFLADGALVTATSGGFEKFETPHLRKSVPYAYSYADILPKILFLTGGKHFHIGNLSEGMLTSIRRGLAENNVDPERFVHIKYVKSIWRAMHDFGVDLYIDSFPLGGGKAIVEVMGSGTPLIAHANYRSPFLCDEPEVYPEAYRWSRPAELFSILRSVTAEGLRAQSSFARRHYMGNNHPDLLGRAISELNVGACDLPQPSRPRLNCDPLQTFLDFWGAGDSELKTHVDRISQLEAEGGRIWAEASEKIDRLSARVAEVERERDAVSYELSQKLALLESEKATLSDSLNERVAQLEGEKMALLASTSWKISAPVRAIKQLIVRKSR